MNRENYMNNKKKFTSEKFKEDTIQNKDFFKNYLHKIRILEIIQLNTYVLH